MTFCLDTKIIKPDTNKDIKKYCSFTPWLWRGWK